MIKHIEFIKKELNKLEFFENTLRNYYNYNLFFYIWKSYIKLNIKYNIIIFYLNILIIFYSIIYIYKMLSILRKNKRIDKKEIFLKFLDNLVLILFLIYFKWNGFVFFLIIKLIIILYIHIKFFWINRFINLKEKILHIKTETILRNIKFLVEKNKNIKIKLQLLKELLNDK